MKDRFRVLTRIAWAALMLAVAAPAIVLAGTITYYHNDLLGSPVAATDSTGHVIWRESYRPYGERLTNDPASVGNDVWYTSRRQDVDTGLVYMGARYYDPVTGRFVSKDPVGFDEKNVQSFNRYAYANNNPFRYVDPNGRQAESMGIRMQERMQIEYLKGHISEEQLNEFYKAQETGASIGLLIGGIVEGLVAGAATATVDAATTAPKTYEILDGVRRTKAADMLGKDSISAEVLDNEGRIVSRQDIPIKDLRSPKSQIEVSSSPVAARRFSNTLDLTKGGSTPPSILVQPGTRGIPVRDVQIK